MLMVSVAVHKPLLTVKVMSLVPLVEYVTPLGLSELEVPGVAPAPKSQLYVMLAPVEPVLVKFTFAPVHCGALEVNEAVGTALILIT